MNKKRRLLAALLALLTATLSGCSRAGALPPAREVEDIALMRTMGVDAAEEGVAVTVSSGVQSKGADKGDEPPLILGRSAPTISGALRAMRADGGSEIFYGHVGQLLLGQALAEENAFPALDYVLRDIEIRLDTALFLVRGATAEAAITGADGADKSAADRLESMEEDGGVASRSAPRTVGEVLADLAGRGCSYAPALAVGADGALEAVGYGILKGGALAAWTEEDEARGINLIQGDVEADVVELTLPDGTPAALRVVGARTKVKPHFHGGRLTGLTVHCTLDANLAENPGGPDLGDEAVRLTIEELLAGAEGARARAALQLAQRLDADFLHLEKRAGLAAPWRWREIQAQWDLSRLDLNLTVEARLLRGYDVDR